jgi:hypothetical protein
MGLRVGTCHMSFLLISLEEQLRVRHSSNGSAQRMDQYHTMILPSVLTLSDKPPKGGLDHPLWSFGRHISISLSGTGR